jgi:hypothetical protein
MAKEKIIIDFNTKFIRPDKRVWILFPGKEYKFYSHFVDEGVVFADLPGMLMKRFDIKNDADLKNWICLSEKVKSYYISGRDESKLPSRDPDRFSKYSWTGPRINAKGVIIGLYSRAKKGDLVLVTSRGGVWGVTQIGEFIDDPSEIMYETFRGYQKERVPARRVRWIGKVDNRTVPEELYRQLISPNAFSLVGRSYYNFVYERAYGNFMRTEMANSMFDIRADEFSTIPDMYLKIIANFAAGVAENIEKGTIEEFLERPLADWLFDIDESVFYANQKISVSSPGKNLLHSVKITPILAVVFFALLCQYPARQIMAAELEFKNSATGGQLDECDIPVVENAKIAFDTMSLEKLELLCKAATKAQKMGRIRTPIKTRVVTDAG